MRFITKASVACLSLTAFCFAMGDVAQAGSLSTSSFIDFETMPGIRDNLAISNQFQATHGVTFGIDNNFDGIADAGKTPFLEEVGGSRRDRSGFVYDQGKGDDIDADAEHDLGRYFLRTEGLGGNGGNLLISYDSMTAAASGELWDIDGTGSQGSEKWLIQALDKNFNILEVIESVEGVSNKAGSLDGKAWEWSFNRQQNDIKAIRFVFAGTKNAANVGIAFDNFRAYAASDADEQAVPEPTSLASLGLMAMLGGGSLLKRKLR